MTKPVTVRERRTQVLALRKKGLSLAKVGSLLDPQVSRQAVWKMLRKIEKNGVDGKRRKAYK